MLEDKIKSSVKIERRDEVFIYPYKMRKNINDFEDLKLVTVDNVDYSDNKKSDIIVTGYYKKVGDDGRLTSCIETGIVAYKCCDDLVLTSEGLKYVNYYINKKDAIFCLKRIKDLSVLYRLVVVFNISKDVFIKVRPYKKLFFNSLENAEDFLPFIDIRHPVFNRTYVAFELNGTLNVFSDFSVCINGKEYFDDNYKEELFIYCCRNKNSLNNTPYDFQKKFSLRFSSFELDAIKINSKEKL